MRPSPCLRRPRPARAELPDRLADAPPNRRPAHTLTPEQIAEGWISLFDGKTLFGWEPTSDADWKVEDDAIRVSKGEQGFLMTTSDFADYELHVEFQAPDTTNSGVFLRTPLKPTDPAATASSSTSPPRKTRSPPARSSAARVGPRRPGRQPLHAAPAHRLRQQARRARVRPSIDPNRGWHAFDVALDGARLTIWLDGARSIRFDDAGRLAQRPHRPAVPRRPRRLPQHPPAPHRPEVDAQRQRPRRLERRQGRGQQVRSHRRRRAASDRRPRPTRNRSASTATSSCSSTASSTATASTPASSSAASPATSLNGYECQISQRRRRRRPHEAQDAGTGAIYRRTTARRVVPKDRQWFTTTLVATGPHIAVWVNGQQVTDWTDDRPPHDNPRNGLRLAPGTIALQGHDPTTNLRFRNLKNRRAPEAQAR